MPSARAPLPGVSCRPRMGIAIAQCCLLDKTPYTEGLRSVRHSQLLGGTRGLGVAAPSLWTIMCLEIRLADIMPPIHAAAL